MFQCSTAGNGRHELLMDSLKGHVITYVCVQFQSVCASSKGGIYIYIYIVCVCVCVCEREGEREREGGGDDDDGGGGGCGRDAAHKFG